MLSQTLLRLSASRQGNQVGLRVTTYLAIACPLVAPLWSGSNVQLNLLTAGDKKRHCRPPFSKYSTERAVRWLSPYRNQDQRAHATRTMRVAPFESNTGPLMLLGHTVDT